MGTCPGHYGIYTFRFSSNVSLVPRLFEVEEKGRIKEEERVEQKKKEPGDEAKTQK